MTRGLPRFVLLVFDLITYFLIDATNAGIDDRPPRNLPSNPLLPESLTDLMCVTIQAQRCAPRLVGHRLIFM